MKTKGWMPCDSTYVSTKEQWINVEVAVNILKEELLHDYFCALMNLLMDTLKQREIFAAPCCQMARVSRLRFSEGPSSPHMIL